MPSYGLHGPVVCLEGWLGAGNVGPGRGLVRAEGERCWREVVRADGERCWRRRGAAPAGREVLVLGRGRGVSTDLAGNSLQSSRRSGPGLPSVGRPPFLPHHLPLFLPRASCFRPQPTLTGSRQPSNKPFDLTVYSRPASDQPIVSLHTTSATLL